MEISQILAIAVFVFTYVLIVAKPKKINEAHAALIGAGITIVLLLKPHHIFEALGISTQEMPVPLVSTWNVVIILATLMVISTLLDDYGFFEYCASRAIYASKNSGRRLFLYTFLVVSLISLFAGNDVVILTTTPIILIFCRNSGINPKPYMYASFFAANTFSMPLYIGNLTNILIGDSFRLDYFGFTKYMLLPTFAAAAVNYFLMKHIFRKQIPQSFASYDDSVRRIKNKFLVGTGIAVLFAVILLGGVANYYKIPLSAVTLGGALVLLILERRFVYRLKRVSWNVVLFVIGLFIVVKGLEVSGAAGNIGGLLFAVTGENVIAAVLSVSLLSALMCNLVNNIPMTAMMLPIVQHAGLSTSMNSALAYSLVIGSNLGANFTTFGALAGILWLESARRYGWGTTLTEFLKIGLFITPIAILGSSIVLALEILLI
ncbi:MAG: SLC13 family permease [Candidatus Methanoperedens sp.]|nr:SLC13 family permease [Candidatus Methanoperedens sp.]MCZ7360052.1 ArsB/NhaD family transporter [Candidatus Methanoperedens sp.]HLB70531.1 SLC13 family permease [Candidatus Methanoperedens sp.]